MLKKYINFLKKHPEIIALFFIFCLTLFYIYGKRTLEDDESLTFALSNALKNVPIGWIDYPTQGYVDRSTFNDFASYQARFDYTGVFLAEAGDAHPPLLNILIHTISSVRYNYFSIWIYFIPHIFFFLITSYRVFKITNIIFHGNKLYGIITMIIFSLSSSTIHIFLFMRMYFMSMMFSVIFLYHALSIAYCNKNIIRHLICIFFTTLLGGLTHYFFLISVACISLPLAGMMLKNKQYKLLSLSFICVVFAVYLDLFVIFPPSLYHLFNRAQGNYAIAAISLPHFSLSRLVQFANISWGKLIMYAILIIYFILSIWYSRYDKSAEILNISLFSYLFFILVVSQISMFIAPRYIEPMTPMAIIGFTGMTIHLSHKVNKQVLILPICIFTAICTTGIYQIVQNYFIEPSWIVARDHNENPALFITDGPISAWRIHTNLLDIMEYPGIYITDINEPIETNLDYNFVIYCMKGIEEMEMRNYVKTYIGNYQIEQFSNTVTTYFDVYIANK